MKKRRYLTAADRINLQDQKYIDQIKHSPYVVVLTMDNMVITTGVKAAIYAQNELEALSKDSVSYPDEAFTPPLENTDACELTDDAVMYQMMDNVDNNPSWIRNERTEDEYFLINTPEEIGSALSSLFSDTLVGEILSEYDIENQTDISIEDWQAYAMAPHHKQLDVSVDEIKDLFGI